MSYSLQKKEVYARMRRRGVGNDLRRRYLDLIEEHRLTHCDHIRKISDWLVYVYFCNLVDLTVEDKDARIIDWGGFYGQVARLLMDLGFRNVHNYLLQRPAAHEAVSREMALPVIWGRDPNRLALEDASVDVFISSGVLEHVEEDGVGDAEVILAEIWRVLRPGGLFFIWNLPAKLSISELAAAALGRWRHQRRYGKREIDQKLRQAGFQALWQDKHKFLPGSLAARLASVVDPVRLMAADDALSHLFPFSVLAQDHALMARRPL